MKLSRRQFIRNVSVAGGALTLGFHLTGCSDRPLVVGEPEDFRPNAFLRIDPEGAITLQIPKAEMGQGIVTGMVTLVAEELEVSPQRIDWEMAPVHSAFADPEMQLQITGGSASIRVFYDVLRQVGASARETLVAAAMQQSGLPRQSLEVSDGEVLASNGSYRATYAQLVPLAGSLPVVEDVALKTADQFRWIGRYDERVDARVKSDGSARFGIDAAPPDALVAVLLRCPWFDGSVEGFEAEAARSMPGVVDIFATDYGVAVVAEGYWYARQAAAKVEVRFTGPEGELRDSEAISSAMQAALDADDFASIREDESSREAGGKLLRSRYELPLLAHAPMEPLNATCRLRDGHCEIWVGSQAPDIARDAASRQLGIPRESVRVYNQYLGGGFGRRAAADNVAEVAAIAQHVQRPVQLVWSREDDIQHDHYRPPFAGELQARVHPDGVVSHWRHRLVGPSINQFMMPELAKAMLPQWVPGGARQLIGTVVASEDFASVEGADSLPYQFDGIQVEYHNLPIPVPLGYWRSVGHSHTAFVVESFVDELAHAAGEDPLAFRRRHLPEGSRERRVMEAVARAAGWGEAAPGRYQGLAVHASFQSYVAEVVEVSLQDGKPRIEHVYCAIDCGQVINPQIVKDQMEGGIAFALSAALSGEITLKGGAVQQSNFHDYGMLRHTDMPDVTVVLVDSDAPPTGVGEPGTPPAAPALANALFAATGERQRRLPLQLG
ncbi:xanthine dehydrogenase family protein molybdopterin-binding subunit [Haliea atlantica]